MGPLTRSVEDQPQHLLEHIADKKNLLTKRSAFHPTIDSACQARSHGGAYGIAPEYAALLMPRGLRPAEKTLEENGNKTVIQGWTWSTDRLLTIRSAQSMSEDYAKAFMTRITCPVFAVMAEEGLFHLKDGKSNKRGESGTDSIFLCYLFLHIYATNANAINPCTCTTAPLYLLLFRLSHSLFHFIATISQS